MRTPTSSIVNAGRDADARSAVSREAKVGLAHSSGYGLKGDEGRE